MKNQNDAGSGRTADPAARWHGEKESPGQRPGAEPACLELRAYRTEDCAEILRWVTDARTHALWCANQMPWPPDEASFERHRMETEREWKSRSFVISMPDGRLLGYFAMNINARNRSAFLAFFIVNADMRGEGYGAQILRFIKEYIFKTEAVEKIELRVFDGNAAALRCYEKAGFIPTAHKKAVFSYGTESWGRFVMEARKGRTALK